LREPSSAFLRHPETGEGAFFERWQREFRQSRHPLRMALHRIVALKELEERSAAVDYLYSRSTFKLFADAKALSKAKTVEPPHNPMIRLEDVAATLLLRVHRSGGTAHTRADHTIEGRLAAVLNALPATDALDKARAGRDKAPDSEARYSEAWVLDADVVDTCALAAHLVQHTRATSVPAVDLDDFVIALLLNPAGQKWIETFLELAASTPPLTVGEILREVLTLEYPRDRSFWDQMLRDIDEDTTETASQLGMEARLPDYVADRPIERLGDDLLDFRGDARAVAEIVCQREPGPPLAIGLFGDWGSGKSSFMNLLPA
jgi:hypothetical protein